MSEQAAPRRSRRRPSPLAVAAGSLGAFLGLFAFLAHAVRTGHDPALGAAAGPQPGKRVLVRRIEHTLIVTRVLPPRGGGQPAATPPRNPTVVSAAPSRAPAPAPAPPPVTTRAS